MSDVRISVIVPTVGRTTLGRTLRSCADADEVIVEFNQDGDRGYAARTQAMARAAGTHLAFIDDDDVFAPGAIGFMRERAGDLPVIFKMRYRSGSSLWKAERLGYGNYGTPCFLVPNVPEKLGRWAGWEGGDSGGDATFIQDCAMRFGGVEWDDRVVALIDPP